VTGSTKNARTRSSVVSSDPESGPPGNSASRLLVSIVNYRTGDLVVDCLRSMVDEVRSIPGCSVIVVDNCSGDGSGEKIAQAIDDNGWAGWASLICATENLGFAKGNNEAIRAFTASGRNSDYVLFLNPDTQIRPRAFRILMDFLDAHPEIGIAGGRSEDPDCTPQLCCFRFPSLVSEVSLYLGLGIFDRLVEKKLTRMGIPEEPTEVGWVAGALMMVRREVFRDIGLMDEGYFLYYEETDFMLRARRAGWSCWHVPESRIVHLVGQSSGVTRRDGAPRRLPRYWFESRRRYFVLNHGRAYAALTDALVILALGVQGLRRIIQPERGRTPGFTRDFLDQSVLLKRSKGLSPRKISA